MKIKQFFIFGGVFAMAAMAGASWLQAQQITGTINKLTFKLGPSQMTADDPKAANEKLKSANH
ncbi:MAG: hypothetical protein WCH43_00670 [Verrucomicrobiota bacterium]